MNYRLEATTRTDAKPEALRENGQLPVVVYGAERDTASLAVDARGFDKIYQEAGTSNLIELAIDGKEPVYVLIKDWQRDPVKQDFIHVDLYQVIMGQVVDSVVTLNFIGDSPAEKVAGGTLITMLDSVNVNSLPKDLVDHIDVDLSKLETFDDAIYVKDLNLPEGVTCTDDESNLVVSVKPPRTQEEIDADEATEEMSIDDVEVEEKGKKEGEEGEGEGDGEKEKADA